MQAKNAKESTLNNATTQHNPYRLKNIKRSQLIAMVVALLLIEIVFGIYFATRSPIPSSKTTQPNAFIPANVRITNSGFVPSTITVKDNQGVVWTNDTSSPHIIASDPYPKDNTLPNLNSEQSIATNNSYSYVFNKPGTYTYHDNLNPFKLEGTIIVEK